MHNRSAILFAAFGFLVVAPQFASAGNIVLNPGFELGVTDWTFVGSTGVATSGHHTGTEAGYANCIPGCSVTPESGSISQGVATTIGDIYSVDFWVADNNVLNFSTNGDLSVSFAGTTGYLTTTPLHSNNVFSEHSFTVVATGSTSTFRFASQDVIQGTAFIDDVSVTDVGSSTPEPVTAGLTFAAVIAMLAGRNRVEKGKAVSTAPNAS